MSGSVFKAALYMYGIRVGNGLYMERAIFEGDIDLRTAHSPAGLTFAGSTINRSVDMTDASIGDFTIAEQEMIPKWTDDAELVMTNMTATTIHDYFSAGDEGQELKSWPKHLMLAGLMYEKLGILTGESGRDILERPIEWYKMWLPRGREFSPQPYWQLAAVLRQSGYPEESGDILYASRVHERKQSWDRGEIGHWAVMTLLQYSIGYGIDIRYFRVLIPIILFAAVGFGVLLWVSRKDEARYMFTLACASLGHVLPIALDKTHENIITASNLPRWALLWFYIQKIAGWVLGLFLIAGLAGLTQKG